MDVVQGHGSGRILDQIGHVVHGVDQAVNLLAVNRRDEGGVNQAVDLVRDAVGGALGVVHILRVLGAQMHVGVVRHQLLKRLRRRHDAVGVLVEQLKKIALLGQQFAEQHAAELPLDEWLTSEI